jgi:glycosyltransferase involved in cell wall biosynthesis
MKIAIFSDNFYPEISGISDSVILLGKELAMLGHDIHYFGAKYSAGDFAKANLPNQELDMGANVHFHRFWSLPFLGSPTGQSRIVIPFGLRCLKFRKEKFDIIYTQSPYGMGMEALLMSRLLGIPLIGTNHTPITEFTRYIPLSNPLFDWLGLKFVAWYYNRCKFVTAPYAGILDEMKRYGLKRDSIELSNPIDLKNFIAPTIEEKKELKIKYALSGQVILYTGRIAPEKQVDVIISAMPEVRKIFPEAMLAITGIGNAENDLKALAKKLGLEDSIKFFGRVDDESHVELYQASEIFVVMSIAETQCISMMKAMSVGIPSVAADAWALPNYLGRDESRGFVVPVGDTKALTEKIIYLLGNPEQQKILGENGKTYVSQFSALAVAEKWEGIYKNALKAHIKNN